MVRPIFRVIAALLAVVSGYAFLHDPNSTELWRILGIFSAAFAFLFLLLSFTIDEY